jgi:hypothetical protein
MKTLYKFFEDIIAMCDKCNLNAGLVVGDVIDVMYKR